MGPNETMWVPRTRHPRAIVGGVCAELGDRFGLPVWLFRVGLLVLAADTWWAGLLVYLSLLTVLRTRFAAVLPAMTAPRPGPSHPGPSRLPLPSDDFARLERRLARLESAVTSDELKLRRGFHDLGA